MRKDLVMLKALKSQPAYIRLCQFWMEEISGIEVKRDVAASRGQESSWRYWAGLEKGAKLIMVKLDVEIARLEQEGGDLSQEPSAVIDKLLSEARGEQSL